jgi:type VII secretion protein EccB
MASTPTTKSQVQAYQFVLRRMESALVRKDAVMLHDPMGSHKRATVVGVVLACIGCIGFLVWGLFGGKGSIPDPGSIVIGKDSGSVFVVAPDPVSQKRLVPVLNMTSAKLLVMAQGGGQNGQAPQPTTVKDAALADYPRTPRTGMVNAPDYLPAANNTASAAWAVCDGVGGETTVSVGDNPQAAGASLAPNQSLYVQDQTSGQAYLVYVPWNSTGANPGVMKAAVDPTQRPVTEMYGLLGQAPRPISTNMLNAIPSAGPLVVPDIPGRGQQASYMHSQNSYHVGDVVKETINGTQYKYFVLLQDGKQEISEGTAAVLNAAKPGSGDIPNGTNALTNSDDAKSSHLAVDQFPLAVPKPVGPAQSAGACLSWSSLNGPPTLGVSLNDGRTLTSKPPVKLAQADGSGPRVDNFYMPPGKAAVVRGTASQAGGNSGPLYLISDQGVVYGIKDVATAQGLGVISGAGDIKSAPASIISSLPIGDFLDPAQASFQYDSITQPTLGVNRPLPNPKQQQQAAGSGG